MTLRIGWFTTGAGPGSQRWRMFSAVVEAMAAGDLDALIAFVFCNRARREDEGTDAFLDLVESRNIPLVTHSSRAFRRARGGELSQPGQPLPAWRADYDREVAALIAPYDIDIAVLAGYMLIFTAEMSERHTFLNLHPAAPDGPVGTWQEVIRQLIATNATRSGVMVHIATDELDRGPVVAYCMYPLRGPTLDLLWHDAGARALSDDDPLFVTIRKLGAAREVPLIVSTLRAIADGRLVCNDRSVTDASGNALPSGIDLTPEVDKLLND
jgi:folate-dependent phosphoribosylglycinamide formyltransferase PurN